MKFFSYIGIFGLVLMLVYGVAAWLYPPMRYLPQALPLLVRAAPETLPVPVTGIYPRQIADTWGAPRPGGRKHKGTDIFAQRDTPITSATDGIVVKKGWNNLGGRTITVLGPGGYFHYYAHLEGYGDFNNGAEVQQGDTLGYVGNSGNARTTPTHLHYGIYTFWGRAINPHPLLVNTTHQ